MKGKRIVKLIKLNPKKENSFREYEKKPIIQSPNAGIIKKGLVIVEIILANILN